VCVILLDFESVSTEGLTKDGDVCEDLCGEDVCGCVGGSVDCIIDDDDDDNFVCACVDVDGDALLVFCVCVFVCVCVLCFCFCCVGEEEI